MEPLAARAAAIRIDSDSLQEIEDRHKTFAEAVMAGDRILYKRADYDFHYTIMKYSVNPYIPRMLSSVNLISVSNVSGLVTDPKVSLKGHEKIVSALRTGDPDGAEEAMTRHLTLARNKLMEHRNSS
jgi:GntR family transcriptional repressor for pyruvate dehydrogenase complex